MREKLCKILALVLAVSAMAAALSGCALFPEEEEELPPPLIEAVEASYVTYSPERGTIENAVSGLATVEAVSSVNVSFPTSNGVFMESYFRLGDTVEAGDILCETDNSALEETLKVAEMEAEIAELRFADAQSKWEAGQLSEISWKEAELAIYLARREINAIREEFSATQLVAPISGEITYAKSMAQGEQVSQGETVFTVSDTDEIIFRYVGQNYSSIPVNAEVSLSYELSDGTVKTFTATAYQTPDTVPEGNSDKYAVLLKCDELPGDVTIGMRVDLYYVLEKSEDTLSIRTASIKTVGERQYVYILKDGYRQERDIKTGISNDYYTEVLEGLSENDLVIQ